MKRSTYILILLVIMAIFAFLYQRHYVDLQETNKHNYSEATTHNEKIKALQAQKQELLVEMETAKSDLVIPNMGTSMVLITDTNEECLDDIVSVLDDYGYRGVIAIDYNYSPLDNIDGYLNTDDINRLEKKGYEVVLKVNATDDVQGLYELYSEYFDIKGFYYPVANITSSHINYYKEIDVKNVIIYDAIVNDEEIFSVSAMGSYDTNSKQYFDDGNKQSKVMAFTVGYSMTRDKYVENNFVSMLDRMKKASDEDKTGIGNISKALQRYDKFLEYKQTDEYKEKLAVVDNIQAQIDEIDKQINTID